MEDLRKVESKIESILSENNISKYAVSVVESEKREFNAENGAFTLFRTLFNNNVVIDVYKGTKIGTVAGNDFSDNGLKATVTGAIATCDAAPEDPANDIAPNEGNDVFKQGSFEPDLDLFFSRTKEFFDNVTSEYPQIKIMMLVADHEKKHSIYRNSNGTEFERFSGSYSLMLEYSAFNEQKATGMDGFGFQTLDLSKPFIEQGDARTHLENCIKQLDTTTIPGKFEGTVIFTPDCLGNFLSMTLGNYISDGVILNGTSQWIDKIDKQVADKSIDITLSHDDPRLVCPSCYTPDGFRSENIKLIDNGVLKSFVISLYTANKTGKPVTKARADSVIMRNGNEKIADIIARTKQGLLVGGFSGGHPQTNGEFSGVAKNSFYIENGKIVGAVTETMINGNLGKMFTEVAGISEEVACDGSNVLPYLAVNGIVISGK